MVLRCRCRCRPRPGCFFHACHTCSLQSRTTLMPSIIASEARPWNPCSMLSGSSDGSLHGILCLPHGSAKQLDVRSRSCSLDHLLSHTGHVMTRPSTTSITATMLPPLHSSAIHGCRPRVSAPALVGLVSSALPADGERRPYTRGRCRQCSAPFSHLPSMSPGGNIIKSGARFQLGPDRYLH